MASSAASSWEGLVTTALLGTHHRPYRRGPDWPELPADDLLTAIASWGLCHRVARLPLPPMGLPAGAGVDGPTAPSELAAIFFALLQLGPESVLDGWFRALRQHGLLAPADALPALLTMLAHQAEREADIRPLLGARAAWLMAQNPDWACLADLSESAWQTGTPERRLDLLRRVRVWRPDDARRWLDEALDREPAERRATLLAVLGQGLTSEDVPVLERARLDRRKEVRTVAEALLSRLGESPATDVVAQFRGLPPEAREAFVLQHLRSEPTWPALDALGPWGLLRECTFAWTPELTRVFFEQVARAGRSPHLPALLRGVAPYLDPGQAEAGTRLLADILNGGGPLRAAAEHMLATLNLRALTCKLLGDAV